jgi:urease accessory protein
MRGAETAAPTGWQGQLALQYRLDIENGRHCTIGRGEHSGPLRVLQSLYPEGDAVCHHVLVHPPGGIVGGDTLQIEARVETGAHALITTPGATRFYRSGGPSARQTLAAQVASGARLEWLPLETLVHDAARASNRLRFELAPGASMIGWDVMALGLPASDARFEHGRFDQSIELAAAAGEGSDWIERGVLDLDDPALAATTRRRLQSPLGLGGRSVIATAWCAFGSAPTPAEREALVEAARAAWDPAPGAGELLAGVTSPHPRVLVLRALADRVEPLAQRLLLVWAAWRQAMWSLPACAPRVWRT